MPIAKILYTIILYPLVQIIELAFFLFNKLFDNVGISTIGVSLTVTLLCLPLYIVAEKWQETERDIQTNLKPGIDRIKSCFKGDEQYMILSTFYRQNHYHPMMALRSSFGLLIQIPFFMAAYSCLSNMEALRGASFAFIRDMGQPDALFSIGGFSVNILPIAMTAINCVSGAIYSKGHGAREKIQIYVMALLFLVVLYNSPAGLVLYWTMNNVFSLVKNIFYKMKNPLKVLYRCMCATVLFVTVFVIFLYDGGADLSNRIGVSIPLWLLLPMPLYLRFAGYLLNKPLKPLVGNGRARFALFALSSVSLCVFAGLVLPSEMFASSVQEFSNIDNFRSPNQLLRFPFWQSFGVFVFWSWCVYFLFKERVQTILAVLFTCLLFCGIMNAYAFAGDYGSMDVALKFLDGFKPQGSLFSIVNAVCVFALCAAIIVAIAFAKERIIASLSAISALVFIAISVTNIAAISRGYEDYERILASGKSENDFVPKFRFTKTGKNIVVFMLDRCEACFFDSILKDQPSLKDSFKGFVFYRNTLSFNGHTLMGAPCIYGGYEYTPMEMNLRSDIPLKQKHNEALLMLPRILTEQAGFRATLSDLSWANYSYISDMSFVDDYGSDKISATTLYTRYTGAYKQEHGEVSDIPLSKGLERNIIWVSLFRTVPAALRRAIYYRGSWLNGTAVDGDEYFLDWYSALYYMPDITSFDAKEDSLLLITNDATHSGNDMAALDIIDKSTLSYKNSGSYGTCTVALIAVAKWLDCLKENGVYDNSRIIIVADHGKGDSFADGLFGGEPEIDGYRKDHFYPILLVKDFGSEQPLSDDMVFMTNADVPWIALSGIIENPTNPWTGNPIDAKPKEQGVLVSNCNIHIPYNHHNEYKFNAAKDSWWRVKDNIFEPKNWVQEVQE